MTRMSVGQLDRARFKKTLCQIWVAFRNWPVSPNPFPFQGISPHDLTLGFSDPIYAEAYVKMNGFDILLGQLHPHSDPIDVRF